MTSAIRLGIPALFLVGLFAARADDWKARASKSRAELAEKYSTSRLKIDEQDITFGGVTSTARVYHRTYTVQSRNSSNTRSGILAYPSGTATAVVLLLTDHIGSALSPWPDGTPPAIELARRGFLVVAPDPGPKSPLEAMVEDSPASWKSILEGDQFALDWARSEPGLGWVRIEQKGVERRDPPPRVGVVGIGRAGLRALWLAALDESVNAVFAIGGVTRLADYYRSRGVKAPEWAADLIARGDTESVASLIAPRPLGFLSGERDPSSPPEGARRIDEFAENIYKSIGSRGNQTATMFGRLDDEYTVLQWDMALEFLDKAFLPQGPTPLGHTPVPEPDLNDPRWVKAAEFGLAGWVVEMSQRPSTWTWKDGVIACDPGANEYGWLRAPVELENFLLTVDWRVPEGGNSGIFLRGKPASWFIPPSPQGKEYVSTLGLDWPSRAGLELQAADDSGKASKYHSGSLYRHAAPSRNPTKSANEWNRYTVRCRGTRVEVWCNGRQIMDTDIASYPNTLRKPPLKGYFGLQNHGSPGQFRNPRYIRLE